MAYRRVLVGVDGSSTASHALMEAAELAKRTGAELLIASAYEPPEPTEIRRWRDSMPEEMAWKASGTALVEQILEEASRNVRDAVGIDASTAYAEGDPAECLLEIAEQKGADLIIVGNKGMSGVQRFLLGSVPNRISHHAPCDILIVKTT